MKRRSLTHRIKLRREIALHSFGNRKALGFIWIIVIAAAVLFVVLGAALAYFWFWPSNLKTENLEFSDFTAVEVDWAFEVSITQSSAYSVVISADEKIFDNIEVTQIEDTLVIGLEPGTIDPSGLFRKAEITHHARPKQVDFVGSHTRNSRGIQQFKPIHS